MKAAALDRFLTNDVPNQGAGRLRPGLFLPLPALQITLGAMEESGSPLSSRVFFALGREGGRPNSSLSAAYLLPRFLGQVGVGLGVRPRQRL